MTIRQMALAAAAVLVAAPLAAQNDINTVCGGVPAQAQDECAIVAQAVDAAQPQLGILMAGGNPILGTASTGGVRLGLIPRVSVTGRVNVVGARLPDIRELDGGQADEFTLPAPAIGANVSLGLTQGFNVAPLIGGFGAIDLLGSVSVLPLELVGDDFGENAFSWGAGARVGLIRESFVTPGVSVSLMYRDLGEVSFGQVCEGTEVSVGGNVSTCAADGDFGEIDFGLSNWSARAAVSKRLLGLGLTAGVGYDKFETDASFAFRAPAVAGTESIYRFRDVAVDNDRWSAFLDGSFTVLVASLVGEVGWMQGADPIGGFPSTSDFDPGEGTWFGSVGFRLSL
ncbi:hypothetical protein [Longimicrobium sp.]|uniref:hypothetical protein n=1 Tax=Longimicrobium sp. TaxID=2029185 RepID=UPI002E35DAA7|nr:hypothetical protein [Longimicrobium sp.]HEX6038338.1 hypothetical protein [Longimicrobium sp.]